MRRNRNAALAMCVLAGFAFPVFGQGGIGSGNATPRAPHPYTAKFQITSEQTLANGTTITHESTEIQVVDSQGRHLSEIVTPATDLRPERTSFHVFDPVARTNTSWMVPGTKATVLKMAPPPEPGSTRATCFSTSGASTAEALERQPGEMPPQMIQPRGTAMTSSRENLGTQTIQGVVATGSRSTMTTPAGVDGNDAPLVRTTETWNARSIGLVVRTVTDDPRTGKRTKELVELNQGEPEPAAFQPPEGYEIVNQEMHEVSCAR
jgi:hypothetical protein